MEKGQTVRNLEMVVKGVESGLEKSKTTSSKWSIPGPKYNTGETASNPHDEPVPGDNKSADWRRSGYSVEGYNEDLEGGWQEAIGSAKREGQWAKRNRVRSKGNVQKGVEGSIWRHPCTNSTPEMRSKKLKHRAGRTHADAELPGHKHTRKIYRLIQREGSPKRTTAHQLGCLTKGLQDIRTAKHRKTRETTGGKEGAR